MVKTLVLAKLQILGVMILLTRMVLVFKRSAKKSHGKFFAVNFANTAVVVPSVKILHFLVKINVHG